jgi:gluconolactonase
VAARAGHHRPCRAERTAFSPDEKILYVVESRAMPHRLIWAYDVDAESRLSNKRIAVDANGLGAFDGIKVDTDGNLWCGLGSTGHRDATRRSSTACASTIQRQSDRAHPSSGALREPLFGGAYNNRVFMASSHSVYALFTNASAPSDRTRGCAYLRRSASSWPPAVR